MAATVAGCIEFGLESIAENMISRYNIHNINISPIGDDSVHNEMVISCNGPFSNEADSLLTEAKKYMWNFVAKNNIEGKHDLVVRRKS